MSAKRAEVTKTYWEAYVLGYNDQLVNKRTYRDAPPTDEQLAELLLAFNYTKADAYHCTAVVVTQTQTSEIRLFAQTSADVRAAVAKARETGRAAMSTGSRDPDLFTPEDNTPDIGLDPCYVSWSEQLRLDAIEAQELEHDNES